MRIAILETSDSVAPYIHVNGACVLSGKWMCWRPKTPHHDDVHVEIRVIGNFPQPWSLFRPSRDVNEAQYLR
jgi:hypothetical protein